MATHITHRNAAGQRDDSELLSLSRDEEQKVHRGGWQGGGRLKRETLLQWGHSIPTALLLAFCLYALLSSFDTPGAGRTGSRAASSPRNLENADVDNHLVHFKSEPGSHLGLEPIHKAESVDDSWPGDLAGSAMAGKIKKPNPKMRVVRLGSGAGKDLATVNEQEPHHLSSDSGGSHKLPPGTTTRHADHHSGQGFPAVRKLKTGGASANQCEGVDVGQVPTLIGLGGVDELLAGVSQRVVPAMHLGTCALVGPQHQVKEAAAQGSKIDNNDVIVRLEKLRHGNDPSRLGVRTSLRLLGPRHGVAPQGAPLLSAKDQQPPVRLLMHRNDSIYLLEPARQAFLEGVGAVIKSGGRRNRKVLVVEHAMEEQARALVQNFLTRLKCAFPRGGPWVTSLEDEGARPVWVVLFLLLRSCSKVSIFGILEHTPAMYIDRLRIQGSGQFKDAYADLYNAEKFLTALLCKDGFIIC